MKRLVLSIVVLLAATGAVLGQEVKPPLQALVDQRIVGQVALGSSQLELAGRLKLHLVASEEELGRDRMRVAALNLAFLDVPMQPFTGIRPRPGTEGTGVLSAMPVGMASLQVFRGIAPGVVVLYGQWDGVVELSQLGDLQQIRVPAAGDSRDAVFVAPTQKGTIYLVMVMSEEDLKPGRGGGEGEEGIVSSVGYSLVAFTAQELTVGTVRVPPFVLTQRTYTPVKIDLTWLLLETTRRLCIQPVRIGKITIKGGWPFPIFDIDFTGAGLPFGQPGANTQWRKGDVVFEWRSWKTIWNAAYFTLDIAAGEDADLRAEVNDSDCIEVFFVDEFDNPGTWGGGATFSSGGAGAKVISSDDNAEAVCAGVACNRTHLAHELGHVMGLGHPGGGGALVAGTTGTLMCPSGFNADNPRRNSLNNENNVNNPLFALQLSLVGPAPDCTNDANCGPCFTVTDP